MLRRVPSCVVLALWAASLAHVASAEHLISGGQAFDGAHADPHHGAHVCAADLSSSGLECAAFAQLLTPALPAVQGPPALEVTWARHALPAAEAPGFDALPRLAVAPKSSPPAPRAR